MPHGWGQSYQSNPYPYSHLVLVGVVGHNVDKCIILNANRRTKWGGLGTRLDNR